MVPLDNGLQWVIVKKAIQTDLGIFTHIPACSGMIRHIHEFFSDIQAYSEPCVTLIYILNGGIFSTLTYS